MLFGASEERGEEAAVGEEEAAEGVEDAEEEEEEEDEEEEEEEEEEEAGEAKPETAPSTPLVVVWESAILCLLPRSLGSVYWFSFAGSARLTGSSGAVSPPPSLFPVLFWACIVSYRTGVCSVAKEMFARIWLGKWF
jgi:hypothetical protein